MIMTMEFNNHCVETLRAILFTYNIVINEQNQHYGHVYTYTFNFIYSAV